MKGTLQYCATVDGVYADVGTSKTKNDNEYKIESIVARNRIDEPEVIGQRVYIQAKYLALHANFLDEIEWFFKFVFSDASEEALGERPYQLSTDYLPERNDIEFYIVNIEFEQDV
jgi:hypothetical protein